MQLGELLAALGDSVLTGVVHPRGVDVEVFRVVVPEAGPDVGPGDVVVLPPSLHGGSETPSQVQWIRTAADRGAAAVAVKLREAADAGELVRAGEATGVAVLEINPGVAWHRALAQMSAVLESFGPADAESGDEFLRDLFTLADATSMALGGAVAIMNAYSQILAYSSQPGQPIDKVRMDGILGRRVPAGFVRSHGEVRTWKAGEVRRMDSPGTLPRLVAPVRAGDTFLGSVWVILPSEEITPSMEAVLAAAAKTAAVHLLRYASTTSSSAWRVNQAQVRARLLGHAAAAQERCVVLAVVPCGADREEDAVLREQLASLAGLVVSGWAKGGCTVLDGVVYALLPLGSRRSEDARAIAETIVRQSAESLHQAVAVGLSSATDSPPAGRLESLEAVRWIAANGGGSGWFEEIRIQATLKRASDALAAGGISLPAVDAVAAYDSSHGTDYAATLLAYLESGQNVAAAAAALLLHPNTLRYRLRRIAELFDLSLDEPDARLAAWMFLRLGRGTGAPPNP
ncbi:PucR family transcriptional regulator [Arthrobacter mobilis]|uniref:PucR C-terminal helix-turn-helix domain-containing protein n=1 Tax=Arthrobacter mobilis TaxID=2724944 RepID=A0A7X6HD61_9MICC|nr:helix-turn-helix domain-containing protein [Arthrobacter mobilis]NKX54360.1 hypothetical protein [Arthrobacter mobilis]